MFEDTQSDEVGQLQQIVLRGTPARCASAGHDDPGLRQPTSAWDAVIPLTGSPRAISRTP
jgi:hypothetical protein